VIRKSLLSLVILAGAGAACTSTDVVLSPTSYYAAYTPTVLSYSATSGGILVEVVGNPFDAPKADLERSITGAMAGSHFGPQVDFVTTPPEDFRSPYRIVMVFDSTQGYTQAKLCAQTDTIQPEAGETVKAHAALCAAEQPLTGVNGRVSDVTGPDDPKFGRFIAQMTTNLLPPTNPDRRGGDHGIFF
jgi:hypothetical protein